MTAFSAVFFPVVVPNPRTFFSSHHQYIRSIVANKKGENVVFFLFYGFVPIFVDVVVWMAARATSRAKATAATAKKHGATGNFQKRNFPFFFLSLRSFAFALPQRVTCGLTTLALPNWVRERRRRKKGERERDCICKESRLLFPSWIHFVGSADLINRYCRLSSSTSSSVEAWVRQPSEDFSILTKCSLGSDAPVQRVACLCRRRHRRLDRKVFLPRFLPSARMPELYPSLSQWLAGWMDGCIVSSSCCCYVLEVKMHLEANPT